VVRRFQQVDVFGVGPCSGNPVAVVLDGEGLTTDEMQRFTRWTNLSEATFVLPPSTPDADYRVRIFTLAHELPFAGHPTLGTCHAWLTAGGRPRDPARIVQECGAGLVPLRRSGDDLSFAAPPLIRSGAPDEADLARVVAVLGIDRSQVVDAAWVDNGPGWIGVLLADAEQVLAVEADLGRDPGHGPLDIGVVGMHPPGTTFAYEVRALFGDGSGTLREDPVTGSLNASVAQWLLGAGRVTAPYLARQGTCLGRDGRVEVSEDTDGTVWIGGRTTTVVSGEVEPAG
jgi:PhzF family phenazine biosynthesis protein